MHDTVWREPLDTSARIADALIHDALAPPHSPLALMASAGCFLERRPLAASNLSRPPLSHPPSKRRTISTAMLLPPCQFSLSIEYTYTAHHLCIKFLLKKIYPYWNFFTFKVASIKLHQVFLSCRKVIKRCDACMI